MCAEALTCADGRDFCCSSDCTEFGGPKTCSTGQGILCEITCDVRVRFVVGLCLLCGSSLPFLLSACTWFVRLSSQFAQTFLLCLVITGACPFLTSTWSTTQMGCKDGTFCQVPSDPDAISEQWKCCDGHGGRDKYQDKPSPPPL